MYYYQDSLFSLPAHKAQTPTGEYSISRSMLVQWQSRVRAWQEQILAEPSNYSFDPFSLPPHAMEFYRSSALSNLGGDACIYFIIDRAVPIILYIGETCRSDQRWQGKHDCKRYLERYRQDCYAQSIPVQITSSFWWQTPTERVDRQAQESQLIHQWKSPFNYQNWQVWQTPFVEG